jgi:hypothetical protein
LVDKLMELARANHDRLIKVMTTLTVNDLCFEVRRSSAAAGPGNHCRPGRRADPVGAARGAGC